MARKSRKGAPIHTSPTNEGMKVWKAALYIRLSVEFNDNRGDSLETQRQIMEAYIALCPDIEIVEIYTDNGVSGQTFERASFQRMLAEAESGKIDCVVVKDLSRLGRSAIDSGFYIEKYFPLHHIRFIAVNDQYDSEHSDNSGSHITVPLKNLINEAYAADISKKVRAQIHQSMKDGYRIGGKAPYGYKKDAEDCHKLLVNEDTAPVVRTIFAWAVDGVPLNVIVKRLNEAEIITPGYYIARTGQKIGKKQMGSGKWQTWTVRKILENEIYTGDMVQGKSVMVQKKQIPTKPEDWIRVESTHEPLVSHETFEKVRHIREEAAKKNAMHSKTPYTENILRGRIFCGCCGKNLHRQKNHGRYIYHCISNDRIGKRTCDARICLHEVDLFETILTYIRQEAAAVMGNDLRLRQKDNQIAARKEDVARQISALQKEAEGVKTYLATLYENFIAGVLTKAEYMDLKAGYEKKVSALVENVRTLREGQTKLERKRNEYATLASRLAAVSKDTALTANLVRNTIERIVVNSQTDISVKFSFRDAFEEVMEALCDV